MTTSGGSSRGTTATAGSGATGTGTSGSSGNATSTGATTGTGTGAPPKFDVGQATGASGTGGMVDVCKVNDDMDAVGGCTDKAPPDSFTPDVQWAFMGLDGETQALVTPVVGNLTDDNDDGEIDLCDVPDVVATLYAGGYWSGHLYVLDGATGAVHVKIQEPAGGLVYPALADVDGDGVAEILSAIVDQGGLNDGYLAAWEGDGTLLWQSQVLRPVSQAAVAVGDVDNDGDVEILLRGTLYDHLGNVLWQGPSGVFGDGTVLATMADLDGDDDLELVFGGRAFHHDGSAYFDTGLGGGHPHVADLDGDGLPEVLVVQNPGLALIEHDGTVTYQGQVPNLAQWRPAAIHDVDGDGAPEICVGSSNQYSVLELDLTPRWTNVVSDFSGFAAGTAFDFLGDGSAEAMYADETTLFIFEGLDGSTLLTTPRTSWTQWENPVVADVDNDGSAEIVVVSNGGGAPAVQVIRDQADRWIPARRIWNQHTYHVTNVREDGTVPQVEPRHWTLLNTFRTQAQIAAGGGVCKPEG